MSLKDLGRLNKHEHKAYSDSALAPIAPEYTTGEVLLGAAYRALVLDLSEQAVHLDDALDLTGRLGDAPRAAWDFILGEYGALVSPQLAGQKAAGPKLRLMPLVPGIARFGAVLGSPTKRWDPGTLLETVMASGRGESDAGVLRQEFGRALGVEATDDVLARYIDTHLRALPALREGKEPKRPNTSLRPLWRTTAEGSPTPAERFCSDLEAVIALKPRQTRRQWTALVEALLRIGLGTYVMWLGKVNARYWGLLVEAVDGAGWAGGANEVEKQCWRDDNLRSPTLELGSDGVPWIREGVRDHVMARAGINLLLLALKSASAEWTAALGVPDDSIPGDTPAGSLARFLEHVTANSAAIRQVLQRDRGTSSLRAAASAWADLNPKFLAGSEGPPRNLYFFIRYSLGQLQPRAGEPGSYDQAYLLARASNSNASPWPVRPGPVTLMLLIHCCCRSVGGAIATLEDFRAFLAAYGIRAPAGELQGGACARQMEQMGLFVDSPDAGGGRLLVDPFPSV